MILIYLDSSKSLTAESGSQSKKPKSSSPNPTSEPDAIRMRVSKGPSGFSQTVGPSQYSNTDCEQIIQEQKKRLDERKKELEEKDEQINKLSSAAAGAKIEVEQCNTSQKQQTTKPEIASTCKTSTAGRDARPTNSKGVVGGGPSLDEHKDNSNKDYEQRLQEKEKLLDDREERLEEKDKQIHTLVYHAKTEEEHNKRRITLMETQLAAHRRMLQDVGKAFEINMDEKEKLNIELHTKVSENRCLTDDLIKQMDKLKNTEEKARLVAHNYNETIQDLTKERNELRSRLSKTASDMLTAEGNPHIADPSDPNRALKLSERYTSLYDVPWTDAFDTLTQQHNQDPKAVIQLLLSILKTCFDFCKQTEQCQMDYLRNLFLNPCQAMSQYVKACNDDATIVASVEKALKDQRRRIATYSLYDVKDQCMSHLRRLFLGKDNVTMSAARAYSESCIDLCWLMVLHDPPLHLALDVKSGTKMGSHYSNYGGSGDTIDYVVWPPMYNGPDGEMLTKGTAAPLISKKKAPNK